MAEDGSPEPSQEFDWIPETPLLGKIAILVGIWALIVDVVNILIGAYASGQKVVWAGFVTYGTLAENTFVAHNGIEVSPGDIVFTIIAILILGFGTLVLNKTEEGGIASWISSLVSPERWSSLFDFSKGLNANIRFLVIGYWSNLLLRLVNCKQHLGRSRNLCSLYTSYRIWFCSPFA